MRSKGILSVFAILFAGSPCGEYLYATDPSMLIVQRTRNLNVWDVIIYGNWEGSEGVTRLEPRELVVGRGDTVTWINDSPTEVKFKFGKDLKCKEVSWKAFGFRLEPDKCYVTKDGIPSKVTASVRFHDIGKYEYEVEYVGKDRRERGLIRVRSESGRGFR